MGCTPNAIAKNAILKQYSGETIIKYLQSVIGSKLIEEESSKLRNSITEKFNKDKNNDPSMLDKILAKVKNV